MDSLQLPETSETPAVLLDSKSGTFKVSGRSLSDNPAIFYKPVISWLKAYSQTPNNTTPFIFKFEYLNTESAKSILDVLTILDTISGTTVIWYFNEEDEDMEEIGEELAELVKVPFEFKHYQ